MYERVHLFYSSEKDSGPLWPTSKGDLDAGLQNVQNHLVVCSVRTGNVWTITDMVSEGLVQHFNRKGSELVSGAINPRNLVWFEEMTGPKDVQAQLSRFTDQEREVVLRAKAQYDRTFGPWRPRPPQERSPAATL